MKCQHCDNEAVTSELCFDCISKAEKGDLFYKLGKGWVVRCLTSDEMKEQAARCGCHGGDDYCPCQNEPDRVTRVRWLDEVERK